MLFSSFSFENKKASCHVISILWKQNIVSHYISNGSNNIYLDDPMLLDSLDIASI